MITTFHINDGYKSRVHNSEVPLTPPEQPTNVPINLGCRTSDEDIVRSREHMLTLNVEKLLANSNKTRRKNPGPPRPQNAFILFRKDKCAKHEEEYKRLKLIPADISRRVAKMWRTAELEEVELFRALARLSERLHSQEYEDYKYKPNKQRPKRTKTKKNKERCPESPTASSERDSPSSVSSLSSFDELDSSNLDSSDFSDLNPLFESYNMGSFCPLSNIVSDSADPDNTVISPAEDNNISTFAPASPNFVYNVLHANHNQFVQPHDYDFNQFFAFCLKLYNFLRTNPVPIMADDEAFVLKLYNFWRTNPTQSMQYNDASLMQTTNEELDCSEFINFNSYVNSGSQNLN